MRINKQLLFICSLCVLNFSIGCTSVNAQPSSWQEIVESDKKIWNRRIEDESIIASVRRPYNRILANVAEIKRITKVTLHKLKHKDCVASAMAIEQLNQELKLYPGNRDVIQGSIQQLKRESKRKRCTF